MENANYYKIVQTIENNLPVLSVVAASWESAGKLFWPPPSAKIEKTLSKTPLIAPGTQEDGWTEHECVVKRAFIPTYSQARKELYGMSEQSDTNSEGGFVNSSLITTKPKRSVTARKILNLAKNADAERLNYNQVSHYYYCFFLF